MSSFPRLSLNKPYQTPCACLVFASPPPTATSLRFCISFPRMGIFIALSCLLHAPVSFALTAIVLDTAAFSSWSASTPNRSAANTREGRVFSRISQASPCWTCTDDVARRHHPGHRPYRSHGMMTSRRHPRSAGSRYDIEDIEKGRIRPGLQRGHRFGVSRAYQSPVLLLHSCCLLQVLPLPSV